MACILLSLDGVLHIKQSESQEIWYGPLCWMSKIALRGKILQLKTVKRAAVSCIAVWCHAWYFGTENITKYSLLVVTCISGK